MSNAFVTNSQLAEHRIPSYSPPLSAASCGSLHAYVIRANVTWSESIEFKSLPSRNTSLTVPSCTTDEDTLKT